MLKDFKNTEVGVIPNDWLLISYDEAFDFLTTATYSRAQLTENDEIGYVHYGDIHTKCLHFIDLDKINLPTIRRELQKNYPLIKDGDVIVVDASEDYEGVGKSVEVRNLKNRKAISGLHTFLLRNKNETIANGFKGYIQSNELVKKQMDTLATGLKVYGVSKTNLKKILIPLPPTRAEQTAIALALSEAEGLITQLEKLIAKKQNIKQGAMQKCLNPDFWDSLDDHDLHNAKKSEKSNNQKNLPDRQAGHSSEKWEVKKLGEIGECIRGVSYNGERDLFPFDTDKTNRLFRANNIQECKIIYTDVQYVHNARVKPTQQMQANDILICMANGSKVLVGKAAKFKQLDSIKYTFGAFMGCFRIHSKDADSDFIFYNFLSYNYRSYIEMLLSGSSINNLKPSDIESIQIPFPKKEIQTNISKILSDMDTEIESLEKKLEKYKMIKQGMMQNLLTGKIRLV
ncbi:MAG: restriction endonuclease subunit S [Bacteroidota bacterium]|nr:restriction endonuclease subunit S [Bacteroidota bacterium]